MKSNLILKQFDTESIAGTMNIYDLRTFFGGKIAYTEDNIRINSDAVEYSYMSSGKENGYQYFDKDNAPEYLETEYIENLTDLKDNYHSISLLNQTSVNLNSNTRWKIEINSRRILQDYLFFKFRESRAFQSIEYLDLKNKSINDSIYKYIEYNILDNYKFESIDLYISYSNIPKIQSIKTNILLQFEPIFTEDVYDEENKVFNFNIVNLDKFKFSNIVINYFQTKSSNIYKFDYYFDLNFVKI